MELTVVILLCLVVVPTVCGAHNPSGSKEVIDHVVKDSNKSSSSQRLIPYKVLISEGITLNASDSAAHQDHPAEREHDNYFKELRDTEDSEEEVDSVNELEAQAEGAHDKDFLEPRDTSTEDFEEEVDSVNEHEAQDPKPSSRRRRWQGRWGRWRLEKRSRSWKA